MIRRAKRGKRLSCPIFASPMSGLLSATMISPEGTQFGLDLGVVEVDGGNLETTEFLSKAGPAQSSQFSGFAQRKLAHFKKPDGQLEAQLIFYD